MTYRHLPIILATSLVLFAGGRAGAASYQFHTIAPPSGAPSGLSYYADGLNDAGQLILAGLAQHVSWDYTLVNDIYDIHAHTYTPIPSDPNGTPNSTLGQAINNSGQIVGQYHPPGLGWQGFLYSGGTFTDVNPSGGLDNIAYGISNNGQIVGLQGALVSSSTEGYLYAGGAYTIIDGAPYPANNTSIFGINDSSTAVGEWGAVGGAYYYTNSFVYAGGVITQLSAPGWAYTLGSPINDAGVIAGGVYTDSTLSTGSGFIDDHGVFTFVDVPGAVDTNIYGINNLDQISGYYTDAAGDALAFYATPSVPEPSTWAMLLTGFVGLGGFGLSLRRQRSSAPAMGEGDVDR